MVNFMVYVENNALYYINNNSTKGRRSDKSRQILAVLPMILPIFIIYYLISN
jgi:hypothetical protein